MIRQLDIQDFLAQSVGHLTIDVRSEGEFDYAHIPRAINLPLFNNEERKQVGTTYKKKGKNEAVLEGLDFVGKKMGDFIRFAQPKIIGNKIFIHCWRGGMRSGSMAWLFDLFGYEVFTLKGGYKNYRNYILQILAETRNYKVIGGKTGSGKTQVLQVLKTKGQQIVDLEFLASHKGSAFGMLGQAKQPSTEYFENLLAEELKLLDANQPIWLEDESQRIGTVVLGKAFWAQIRKAPLFVLDVPLEFRVKHLIKEYAHHPIAELENSLLSIQKRLGHEQWKTAVEKLHQNDFEAVAKTALHYYDKTYAYGLTVKDTKEIQTLHFDEFEPEVIAEQLITAGVR